MAGHAALIILLAGPAASSRAGTPQEEADALYREPRTSERVLKSLAVCEAALAKSADSTLAWRAARACAWLGKRGAEKDQRAHVERGIVFCKDAIRAAPASPEGYYFHGLNLGILSRIDRTSRWISRMERMGKKLVELDEKFGHAGGRRLIGLLYLNTHAYPFVGAGSLKEAEEHLRRACELSPDYGYNQLSFAKVLLKKDKDEEARRALEKVIASSPPAEEAEDHVSWIAEAKTLLEKIARDS